MQRYNFSNARANLAMLLEQATAGEAVESSRRGKESVVIISKASYEAYHHMTTEAKPYPLNGCGQVAEK